MTKYVLINSFILFTFFKAVVWYCPFISLVVAKCLRTNNEKHSPIDVPTSSIFFPWNKFILLNNQNITHIINTSYLTDSYVLFTLKMESVYKITIFGLKMMVKSGLEKMFLKLLHAEVMRTFAQNCKFSNKNDLLSA